VIGPLGVSVRFRWGFFPGIVVALTLLGAVSTAGAGAPSGETGAQLYREACASCHGPAGRGDGWDADLYDPRPRDLRSGFLDRYDTDDLVRRVREGKPLELALDLPALRARAVETEAIVAHLQRLPDANWRQLEVGQEVYVDRCELCHGPFGRGRGVVPPGVQRPRDISDPAYQRGLSDQAMLEVVRHGRKGMPALVPQVPDADITALAAFVGLLSPGFELYSRHCAACHGDDGRADGGVTGTPQRPTVIFDRAYFQRRDPEEIRGAIWHMLAKKKPTMPHMRFILDEAPARAIIEYLKGAPGSK